MKTQKLFMLCVVAVAGAGCGENAGGPDVAEVGLETQDETDGWPRAAVVFYGNEGFRQMMTRTYVNEPGTPVEYNYQRGGVKSFALYPSCKVEFYDNDGKSKTYDNRDNPYYVQSASLSKEWTKVYVHCNEAVIAEDANLFGETVDSNAQDQLPLFRQDDLTIISDYNFKDRSESIDVAYERYVVLYKNGKRHSTALYHADLSSLGIDSNLTKTEVRNFSAGAGEYGCTQSRRCYRDSNVCYPHSADYKDYGDSDEGDLEDCSGDNGQSYCTGQGFCVHPSDGEPVIFGEIVDPH